MTILQSEERTLVEALETTPSLTRSVQAVLSAESFGDSDLRARFTGLVQQDATASAESVPSHLEELIDQIRRGSRSREAIAIARRLLDTAKTAPQTIDRLIDQAVGELVLASKGVQPNVPLNSQRLPKSAVSYGTFAGDLPLDVSTPLRGEFIVIGARPCMGKTALALDIARRSLLEGRRVAVFSVGQSDSFGPEEWMAASAARVERSAARNGRLNPEQQADFDGALALIRRLPHVSASMASASVVELAARARRFHESSPLDLIVVDGFASLEGVGRHGHGPELAAKRLKALALALNCPVIATAGVTRGVERRWHKVPYADDLWHAKALTRYADTIVTIYRDQYYEPESESPDFARLTYTRDTRLVWVHALFEPDTCRFERAPLEEMGSAIFDID